MVDALDVLDEAIDSVTKLRRALGKRSSRQVTAREERALAKATALAWIREHRPRLDGPRDLGGLETCDTFFRELLEFSDRDTTRERYKSHLSTLRSSLVSLRSAVAVDPQIVTPPLGVAPPNWSRIVSDPSMQAILSRRWQETSLCLGSGAALAATVMMGAMLEALLLSRINRLSDKSEVFQTKSCPKDKKSGKSLQLQHWTLQHYIDVAHEMGWIRQAARDVGVVLRDYRNYIHPSKELSHGVRIEREDAEMFWVVFQSLSSQIASSV